MEWRRPLLIGLGWGSGPPKAWNSAAIKAEYIWVDTEGDKNTTAFHYTVENTTDFDYTIEQASDISLNVKLGKENSIRQIDGYSPLDLPVFVPAKRRTGILVHLHYACPDKEAPNADDAERKRHRQATEEYVREQLPNLDGFEIFDRSRRYDIVFPNGWKTIRKLH